MEIDSFFCGTRLKSYRHKVDWRSTMNYAAAVDDGNDFYFDDLRFDRLVAHPMYCSAVTWPVVERIWEFIEADNFPMEVLATQVHYSEHLRFYRLVSPGDRLHVSGRIAAILAHRSGTRVVIRFDVADDDGNLVFTEHIGSIMRGVKCLGDGKGSEVLPEVPGYEPSSKKQDRGASIWTSEIFIDALRPYVYDGCTDIVFPIHTSRKFSRQMGLPGIILQGTATLAFSLRELINRETGGDPTRIHSLYARFSGMVIPGTTIRINLLNKESVPDGENLYFCVLNQAEEYVIKEGFVKFLHDPDRFQESRRFVPWHGRH